MDDRILVLLEQYDCGLHVIEIAEAVGEFPDVVEAELMNLITQKKVHAIGPSVFAHGIWTTFRETLFTILFLGNFTVEEMAKQFNMNEKLFLYHISQTDGIHVMQGNRVRTDPTFLYVLGKIKVKPSTIEMLQQDLECDSTTMKACLMHLYRAKRIFQNGEGLWTVSGDQENYLSAGISRVSSPQILSY